MICIYLWSLDVSKGVETFSEAVFHTSLHVDVDWVIKSKCYVNLSFKLGTHPFIVLYKFFITHFLTHLIEFLANSR